MLIQILIIFIEFLVIDTVFFDNLGRVSFRWRGKNMGWSIRGRDRGWEGLMGFFGG